MSCHLRINDSSVVDTKLLPTGQDPMSLVLLVILKLEDGHETTNLLGLRYRAGGHAHTHYTRI